MLPRVWDAQLVTAKVIKDKRRVLNVARVNLMTMLMQRRANFVQTRHSLVAKEETKVALLAQRAGRPKTAVPNAPRAVRGRLALGVKIACPVNTVRVAMKMPLPAVNAPLVLVNVIKDKLRAFLAVPVNSTMLQVPSSVNFV